MTKYLRQFLDFLLFSNIFIALGAVAQGLVTYHLLGYPPSLVVLGFLFFSTILIYNLSILIQKPKNHLQSKYRRVKWIFGHYRLNISITLIAISALIGLFFLLSWSSQLLMGFLSVLSLGYALPLFSSNGKKFGLRKIPGLKLFLIAFVWAFSAVVLPIFELQSSFAFEIPFKDIAILTLKRFLFVAAITIPFDIRDIFQDKTFELKTIPTVFGEKKAYLLCQFMLISYLILLFLFQSKGLNSDFLALSLTTILTGWLIFKSKWEKNEYYYFLYLDGTLILQYLMLIFFSFMF
jgi:4-hydroxybenzoate polyprenyltransferase